MSERGYAGDVTAREAWEMLKKNETSCLLDCRTDAEWSFVGVVDESLLGRKLLYVAWQLYPHMQQNPSFIDEVRSAGVDEGYAIFCLCRSGGRSRMAAMALTAAGFTQCYNIATGFEGGLDENGKRGTQVGWKAEGLPWRQG